MITEFSRNSALSTKDAIQAKMQEVEQLLGVSVIVQNVKVVSAQTLEFSMTASVSKEAALKDTAIGKTFLAVAPQYGFKPEHLGKTFMYEDDLYQVVGWNTRAPKYPIWAEKVATRKHWRFPVSIVLNKLTRA